jgi:cyclase
VVVGIDVRAAEWGYEVCTHGGRQATGIDAVCWAARCEALGAGEIVLNSMDRDGTRDGFDLELTRLVVDACNIPVVASGGVGRLDHLVEGAAVAGADAVLAASIFHFGEVSVAEAKAHLARAGVPVRPIPAREGA